jgi:hypothetical protein
MAFRLSQLGDDHAQRLAVGVGAQKRALRERVSQYPLGDRTPFASVAVEQGVIGARDDGGEFPAEVRRVLQPRVPATWSPP